MMKNKVILIYKHEYGEIGGFTATRSELLVLSNNKAVIYNAGSGYEGENDHVVSRTIELKPHSHFVDDCFEHIYFSYENKENVVDCSGYGGTNDKLFQIKIVEQNEVDPRLVNGELYFDREYELIRQLKFNEYYSIEPFAYSLAGIIPSNMWPDFIRPYIKSVEELALKAWENEKAILQTRRSSVGAYLGKYPQRELKDEAAINYLNEQHGTPDTNDKWCDFGYRANDYQGGYMFYIDVFLGDDKYRGVYIKEYRPNSYRDNIARNFDNIQESNGYKKNTVYWFKFEPLQWIECGKRYSKRYVCLNVIDAEPMYDQDPHENKGGGENYFYSVSSYIHKWLRNQFVKDAFDEGDCEFINVDLLSKNEYLELLPLKNQRKPRPTDYALIKGYLPDLRSRGNDFPFVWTATYLEGYNRMVTVSKDGSIIDFYSENHGYIIYIYGGVQPSISLLGAKGISAKNKFTIKFDELENKTSNSNVSEEPTKKEEAPATKENKTLDFNDFDIVDDDLPF